MTRQRKTPKKLPEFTIRDVESWSLASQGVHHRDAYICFSRDDMREVWERLGSPERFNALDVLLLVEPGEGFYTRDGGRYFGTSEARWLAAHMTPKGWRGYVNIKQLARGWPSVLTAENLRADGFKPVNATFEDTLP